MKKTIYLSIVIILFLSACAFSLAEDVTPPPDYIAHVAVAEPEVLFPEEKPSPERGEAIYLENCATCHGEGGLGNGPMAVSQPVAVPAIGLREISSQASPAEWFRTITVGSSDRGMPDFSSLSSEERWDVLSYTILKSATASELELGSGLFASHCAECHGVDGRANPAADLGDQESMSQNTGTALYRVIAEGRGTMRPFGGELREDELWATIAYLRTLTYDMSQSAPTVTVTVEPTDSPEAVGTPIGAETSMAEGTETVTDLLIDVAGTVINDSGTELESGVIASLVLYNTTQGQVFNSMDTTVAVDGSFEFTDVYADAESAYWVFVDYEGVTYYSEYAMFDGATLLLELPVIVYDATDDWHELQFDLVHIAMQVSGDILEVSELFVISNPGNQTVTLETDGTSLAFIELPEGVTELSGLSPDSNGASFLSFIDGIGLPPLTGGQYGVVATFSMPYDGKVEFVQNFPMEIVSLTLFAPEGVRIRTAQLEETGPQDFGGTMYTLYETTDLQAGLLNIRISGGKDGAAGGGLGERSWLILGSGGLGIVFVLLGIFFFLRDRRLAKMEEEEEDDSELEMDALGNDPESLTDAIIALDEQLKKGEISREAYEKRRGDLKNRLKEIL